MQSFACQGVPGCTHLATGITPVASRGDVPTCDACNAVAGGPARDATPPRLTSRLAPVLIAANNSAFRALLRRVFAPVIEGWEHEAADLLRGQ